MACVIVIDCKSDYGKIVGVHNMHVDIIKNNNNSGAVFFKYQTSKVSPVYNVTLPFVKNEKELLEFSMTEETLNDLIMLIRYKLN